MTLSPGLVPERPAPTGLRGIDLPQESGPRAAQPKGVMLPLRVA